MTSSPETREGFIEYSGARIHYTSAGQGKALIFVHAGIADSRMWQPQVNYFSQNYCVVTLDLRGYGQTARIVGDFNLADDLRAVMDGLKIEKAVLIGCSMGGNTVINFTLQNPGRVLALVTVSSDVDGFEGKDTEESERQWQAAVEARKQQDFDRYAEAIIHLWIDGPRRKPQEVDPAVRAFVKEMLRTSFDTPQDLGRRVWYSPPAAQRLGEIHAPTLVIGGEEDIPEMAPYTAKLSSDIPGARLAMIADAGHLPGLEHPAEFNRLLEDFLESVL